ncbi:MAG: transposase, partial [Desulfobacter sp.]
MKISTVEKNGITPEVVEVVCSLVGRISWPERRQAMADVTNRLLDGKPRVAEDVFGWGRATVEMGINELRTGIV